METNEFVDDRLGFLTEPQEKKTDTYIKLKGLWEAIDGPTIKVADNRGLQLLKEKFLSDKPDVLQIVYEVIDAIFAILPDVPDEVFREVEKLMKKKNKKSK
jgi:hypothetical protein